MSTLQTIEKAGSAFDELSKAIRDPDSQGAIAGAIGRAGQRFCDAFSAGEALNDGAPGAQLPLVGLGRVAAAAVCDPYFKDKNYSPPELGPPALSGGQCIVPYEVYTTTRNPNGTSNGEVFSGVFNGPFAFDSGTAPPFPCDPGFTRIGEQFLRDGSGNIILAGGNGCFASPPFASFRFVRVDGMPDDCGNQDGDIAPGPNPAPSPGPFPSGQEPGFGEDGQPFFFVPPIDTPFGELPIPPDYFDPSGGDGGAISPAPAAGGDGLPGLADAVAPQAGSSVGGEDGQNIDFGEPPTGRVWVGCIVEITADPRIGNIPGTGPSNTVWPQVLGNAALRFGNVSGSNVRLFARYSDLFRPTSALIVTGCFLQTQIGANAQVFPISAETCPSNPCEE